MHVWPQSGFSGENNVGRVIKEELAHKMSKYKYEDGNGNFMLQKYKHNKWVRIKILQNKTRNQDILKQIYWNDIARITGASLSQFWKKY